jgi:hypothetical protein
MKTFATIAAAAAVTLGTGAFAQSASERAIAHFNQDKTGNEVVEYYGGQTDSVTVSTRSGDALSRAFALFNAQVDGQNPASLRGTEGASGFGTNAVAVAKFADIAAENRDDDI